MEEKSRKKKGRTRASLTLYIRTQSQRAKKHIARASRRTSRTHTSWTSLASTLICRQKQLRVPWMFLKILSSTNRVSTSARWKRQQLACVFLSSSFETTQGTWALATLVVDREGKKPHALSSSTLLSPSLWLHGVCHFVRHGTQEKRGRSCGGASKFQHKSMATAMLHRH